MRQEKLDSLSLLMIETDLLCKINFEDMINDFAGHISGEKSCQMFVFTYL